jgi:5-methylthioadenosine/S-adenosylhomocysteine deaminase
MARRLIRNVLLLSPNAASGRGYLLVDGERLADVGLGEPPAFERLDEALDAGGLTAIPGLINCHTHASLSLHRLCDDADLFAWAAHNYLALETGCPPRRIDLGRLQTQLEAEGALL